MSELTTYKKCRQIRQGLVNQAANVMTYKSWSDESAAKEIREFPDNVKNQENGDSYYNIQLSELTAEEAIELGFCKWSDENPIYLIPLWLLPFLAEELEVGCIDDKPISKRKKSELDNDNRFGCLAYGIMPRPTAHG